MQQGATLFALVPERSAQILAAARTDPLAAALLQARCSFAAERRGEAIEAIRTLAAARPDEADPAFLLCCFLLATRDGEAPAQLASCLARRSEAHWGWADLAAVLLDAGQTRAALVALGRAPPHVALLMRRGQLARELGDLGSALHSFRATTVLAPRSVQAWFHLGTAAQDSHDLATARLAYETVLRLDPAIAEAAVNLGIVRQESGDLEGARLSYREAVRQRPDTVGRIAQALATAPKGELWLDLARLRRDLAG